MFKKIVLSMVVMMMAGAAFAEGVEDADGAARRAEEQTAIDAGRAGSDSQTGVVTTQVHDAVIGAQQSLGESGKAAASIALSLKNDGGASKLKKDDGTLDPAVVAKAQAFINRVNALVGTPDGNGGFRDANAARIEALREIGKTDQQLADLCGG